MNLQTILHKMIKIFLIGLVLHFFLYNTVTYSIGFQNETIWLWKEIFIIIFVLALIYYIFKNNTFKSLLSDKTILGLELIFTVMVILTFIINLFKGSTIGEFFMAFKYDFIGYMIFFVSYHLKDFLGEGFGSRLAKFYGVAIKVMLVFALCWYAVIAVKPGALKYFGYDKNVYEGVVGKRPPAVYLTQLNTGYARNQFLFERPISWGFYLTAFFPLFFVLFLRRRSFGDTWHRWAIYGLNIVVTYSRAAWGAWIFEILLLGLMENKADLKKYFKVVVLPLFLFMGFFLIVGYSQIVSRYFSNSGHIRLLKEGFDMFMEAPITGKGASTAGPASHRLCEDSQKEICQEIHKINVEHQTPKLKGFNTENQYLQILVEFGLSGFLFWIAIYGYLCYVGIKWYLISDKKSLKEDKNNPKIRLMIAMSIGLIGLGFEGMVLHSFSDRMIVYPMMLLFGMIFMNLPKKA